MRQALNVYRMKLLGAEVRSVKTGTGTLKDAVSEAMREWTSRISDTHYCLGSVMGPHPFPTIDAVSEAMREWTSRISDTHYCLGSVMGPHPFPTIVRDFQAVISKEIKKTDFRKGKQASECHHRMYRRRLKCHRQFLSFS